MLPDLKKYAKATKDKKVAIPTCSSYKTVVAALQDPLLAEKILFFIMIANELEPFMTLYQTDSPMLIYMFNDLTDMIRSLLSKFIKTESIPTKRTSLHTLKYNDKSIQLENRYVGVGFAVTRQIQANMKASDREKYSFRAECVLFMTSILDKLLCKSPLKYPLFRSLNWLNPAEYDNKQKCAKDLYRCLQVLVDQNRIHENICDKVNTQYVQFVESVLSSDHDLKNSSKTDYNIDQLYYKHLAHDPKYQELWKVVELLLVLSHGQSSVERGFSINKEMVVENLAEETLVAHRVIVDTLRRQGGPTKAPISAGLLTSCAHSRQRYVAHLEKRRTDRQLQDNKRTADDKLSGLYKKEKRLKIDIDILRKSSNEKAEEADLKRKWSLLTESNALRHRADEKQKELTNIENEIKLIGATSLN